VEDLFTRATTPPIPATTSRARPPRTSQLGPEAWGVAAVLFVAAWGAAAPLCVAAAGLAFSALTLKEAGDPTPLESVNTLKFQLPGSDRVTLPS